MAKRLELKETIIEQLEQLIAESDKSYDVVRIREAIDLIRIIF